MPASSSLRRAAVAVLALGLTAAAAVAHAAPSPDAGPTAGGTVVSGELPGFSFTDVSAGGVFSVALGQDGLLYSWGQDARGQLGNGAADTTAHTSPAPVDTPAGLTFTRVVAGFEHALALGSDGVLYAWGANDDGELGNGTTTDSPSPTPVSLPSGATVADLAAGNGFSAALLTDGRLLMWGDNASGQLGIGSSVTTAPSPVQVTMPAQEAVISLSANSSRANHMMVIVTGGRTYSWGSNDSGQLGTGARGGVAYDPVTVQAPAGLTFTHVTAGWGHSLAIASDGTLWAWGDNDNGELGDGTTVDRSAPVAVTADPALRFTAITSTTDTSGAIASDGTAYAWGLPFYGLIGNGSSGFSPVTSPAVVQLPAGVAANLLRQGGVQSHALGSDGRLYTWGTGPGVGLGSVTGTVRTPTVQPVDLALDQVTFGGVPGTAVAPTTGGWTATTPGGCGPVDVAVGYRVFGGPTQQEVTTAGFTYGTAPAFVDQPESVQVGARGSATLSVTVAGDDAPAIQWQTRTGTGAWTDVPGATGDTLTRTPTADEEVRAVATNCLGSVTSDIATLTVAAPPVTPTPSPTPTTAPPTTGTGDPGTAGTVTTIAAEGNRLAITGATVTAIVTLAVLLAGAGTALVLTRRRAR